LLVDDEPDLLATLKTALERKSYNVHAFTNPIKAWEHIKEAGCMDCSIVVTDIRMPGMTGLELAMRLKDIRPAMKIILMTGLNIGREDLQKIIPHTPIEGLLRKPFRSARLIEAIRGLDDRKQE